MRVVQEDNGWAVYMEGQYPEIRVAWFLMAVAADRFVQEFEGAAA